MWTHSHSTKIQQILNPHTWFVIYLAARADSERVMCYLIIIFKKISLGIVEQRNEYVAYLTQEGEIFILQNRRFAHMITWDRLGQCRQARRL